MKQPSSASRTQDVIRSGSWGSALLHPRLYAGVRFADCFGPMMCQVSHYPRKGTYILGSTKLEGKCQEASEARAPRLYAAVRFPGW
jgi:hypothetical protein